MRNFAFVSRLGTPRHKWSEWKNTFLLLLFVHRHWGRCLRYVWKRERIHTSLHNRFSPEKIERLIFLLRIQHRRQVLQSILVGVNKKVVLLLTALKLTSNEIHVLSHWIQSLWQSRSKTDFVYGGHIAVRGSFEWSTVASGTETVFHAYSIRGSPFLSCLFKEAFGCYHMIPLSITLLLANRQENRCDNSFPLNQNPRGFYPFWRRIKWLHRYVG